MNKFFIIHFVTHTYCLQCVQSRQVCDSCDFIFVRSKKNVKKKEKFQWWFGYFEMHFEELERKK